MESGLDSRPAGTFLAYDPRAGRLLLLRDGDRNEIPIRAQAHRLVRYMVERNAAAGGVPVLCTHDELMRAVWADEPMHTREELAKLVWELRKKLEPFDAVRLIENERGLGYRLHAGELEGEHAGSPSVTGPVSTRARLSRPWIMVAVAVAALALVGGLALALTRGSGGGSNPPARPADVTGLRTFVDRVENVLEQSAAGRREVAAALTAGSRCAISPQETGRRIASVADNRQSVLEQLGGLRAPTADAAAAVTLLQRALQDSIEADRHYRDGFLAVTNARCPVPQNQDFQLASAMDVRATKAKQQFVKAFNPLAKRFGRRTWTAGQY